MRFFIFIVEVDDQFVGAISRSHDHATLLTTIFHSRRRRRINVGNFGFDTALSQYRTLRVAECQGVAFAAFKLAIFGDVQSELRAGLSCRNSNGLADRRLGKVSIIRTFVGKGDGNGDFFIRCFVQADGISCRFAFFHLGRTTNADFRLVRVIACLHGCWITVTRTNTIHRGDITTIFHSAGRKSDFTGYRIYINAGYRAINRPLTRRRVLANGRRMRLLRFIVETDNHFICTLGRRDDHAALCVSFGNRWRIQQVVINNFRSYR